MGRLKIKRGVGKKRLDGKSFRLADEVRYIQGKAAECDARVVNLGQLVLFSTDTGDAWLLDTSDHLATRLAQGGDPDPVHIEDTQTNFTIAWNGCYRIDGHAFVYADNASGRVLTILGYPTHRIQQLHSD